MGKRHFLADLILVISRKYEVPVLDLVVFLFSFECLTNQQNANLKVPAACCIIPNACIFVSPLQDWNFHCNDEGNNLHACGLHAFTNQRAVRGTH